MCSGVGEVWRGCGVAWVWLVWGGGSVAWDRGVG